MTRQIKTTATQNDKAAAAARVHVQCVESTQQGRKDLLNNMAASTLTAIQSIHDIYKDVVTNRQTFLDVALTVYKGLVTWPTDTKGQKVGEKAAGPTGKAYVALRSMCHDRFTDAMKLRTVEEMAKYRSDKAKKAKKAAAAEAEAEFKAKMASIGAVAAATMTADKAFELFLSCFDDMNKAAAAFGDMVKAAKKAAADKLAADKAAVEASKAADKAAKEAAEADKAAAADKAAKKAADKAAKLAKHNTRRAAKLAALEIQHAETREAAAADVARIKANNSEAAAATLA